MSDQPTDADHENAARRAESATVQNAKYAEAAQLALAACGPGWHPWMLISAIPSDHRQAGDSTPVAVVVKAYMGEHKLTENSVFIRRMPDVSSRKAKTNEELFGELLDEKPPMKAVDVPGQPEPVASPSRRCLP